MSGKSYVTSTPCLSLCCKACVRRPCALGLSSRHALVISNDACAQLAMSGSPASLVAWEGRSGNEQVLPKVALLHPAPQPQAITSTRPRQHARCPKGALQVLRARCACCLCPIHAPGSLRARVSLTYVHPCLARSLCASTAVVVRAHQQRNPCGTHAHCCAGWGTPPQVPHLMPRRQTYHTAAKPCQ